jgi:hypothetical protein
MERSDIHQAASGRGKARREFLVHATVYAAVMVLLIMINRATRPATLWFIWPLFGWGLAVMLHWVRVLLVPGATNTAGATMDRALHCAGESRSGKLR